MIKAFSRLVPGISHSTIYNAKYFIIIINIYDINKNDNVQGCPAHQSEVRNNNGRHLQIEVASSAARVLAYNFWPYQFVSGGATTILFNNILLQIMLWCAKWNEGKKRCNATATLQICWNIIRICVWDFFLIRAEGSSNSSCGTDD